MANGSITSEYRIRVVLSQYRQGIAIDGRIHLEWEISVRIQGIAGWDCGLDTIRIAGCAGDTGNR